MDLIDKGVLPVELIGDIAVDVSSMPRKDEIKQRIKEFQQQQKMAAGQVPGQVPGQAPGQVPPQPQLVPGQGMTEDGNGNLIGPDGLLAPKA